VQSALKETLLLRLIAEIVVHVLLNGFLHVGILRFNAHFRREQRCARWASQ
jgi:hypothetical protein